MERIRLLKQADYENRKMKKATFGWPFLHVILIGRLSLLCTSLDSLL